MLPQMAKYHFFFWLSSIPFHLLYSLVEGYLGSIHISATVNNAAINMWVHVCLQISVFLGFFWGGDITWSEIAGADVSSSFSFLRNIHRVFHSGCTSSHCHQEHTRDPIFAHLPLYSFVFSKFFFNLLYFWLFWVFMAA